MPVIEFSCGMVMSVSAAEPRICCIRCGGVEFHVLERDVLRVGESDPLPVRSFTTGSLACDLASLDIGGAVTDPFACQCYV